MKNKQNYCGITVKTEELHHFRDAVQGCHFAQLKRLERDNTMLSRSRHALSEISYVAQRIIQASQGLCAHRAF